MHLGPHAGFIIAAYAVASGVVLLLLWWVRSDYRAQLRLLRELERCGLKRAGRPPRP